MKHYDKLIELGCFSRSDLSGLLGNDATAGSMLYEYQNQGYIERERIIADKIQRLESMKLRGKIVYSEIKALSTEARQKLERIDPDTVAQASRIPGISPSDINILLLLLGR